MNDERKRGSPSGLWRPTILWGIAWLMANVAAIAWWYWHSWIEMPDLEVSGTVADETRGSGIADAFVIVSISSRSGASVRGNPWHCSGASAVVRTDDSGRFSYRVGAVDAFGRRRPRDWRMSVDVYHPQFLPAPKRPSQEESGDRRQGRVPTTRETPPWRFVEGGPTRIDLAMSPTQSSAWPRLERFSSDFDECLPAPVDRGHAFLVRDVHQRAWNEYCHERSSTHAWSDYPIDIADAYRTLENLTRLLAEIIMVDRPEAWRDRRREERIHYVNRHILENFPRSPDWPAYAAEGHVARKNALCDFYAPPLDRLLMGDLSMTDDPRPAAGQQKNEHLAALSRQAGVERQRATIDVSQTAHALAAE